MPVRDEWLANGKRFKAAIIQLVKASYKGLQLKNEASFILAEYSTRKALRKLGYHDDISNLDTFTNDCFMLIETEIEKLQEMDRKKLQRKK